jgi:RHS repeat-associated protein
VAVYEDLNDSGGPDDDDEYIAKYQYDGLGRRIVRTDCTGASEVTYHDYYTPGWQLIEVRKDGKTDADVLKQYVWGLRYIDAPILRDRETDAGSDGLDERLYYTQDGNFNVTALVNPAGQVVERYSYDAYGRVTVRNGAENVDADTVNDPATEWDADPDNASDVDNRILYCGYRFDSETGLYHVRHRYLHPTLGRWTSQDPAGYVDGLSLYEYCRSSVVHWVDPFGLEVFSTDGDGGGIYIHNPATGAYLHETDEGEIFPAKPITTPEELDRIAAENPEHSYPDTSDPKVVEYLKEGAKNGGTLVPYGEETDLFKAIWETPKKKDDKAGQMPDLWSFVLPLLSEYASPSKEFQLAHGRWMLFYSPFPPPPGVTVELEISAKASLGLCCDKDGRFGKKSRLGVQVKLTGQVELSGGVGTIIGGRTDVRIAKTKKGGKEIRDRGKTNTGRPKTTTASPSKYNGWKQYAGIRDRLKTEVNVGKVGQCFRGTKGTLTGGVKFEIKGGIAEAAADIEIMKWELGKRVQWKFDPSTKASWGSDGVGIRAEVYGEAEIEAGYAIFPTGDN